MCAHSFVYVLCECRISKATLNEYSEKVEAIASKLINHEVCIYKLMHPWEVLKCEKDL